MNGECGGCGHGASINTEEDQPVEVVLLSRNDPDTELRVFKCSKVVPVRARPVRRHQPAQAGGRRRGDRRAWREHRASAVQQPLGM